jgi:hypothetical protein
MGAPWPIPEVSPGLTATSELQAARGKAQGEQPEQPQQQGAPREEQPQAQQQQQQPAPEPAAAPPPVPPPAAAPPAAAPPAGAPDGEAGEEGESEEQLYRLYDAVKVKPCSVAAVRKLYQQRDSPLRTRERIIDDELERVYRCGCWRWGCWWCWRWWW